MFIFKPIFHLEQGGTEGVFGNWLGKYMSKMSNVNVLGI